MIRVLSVLLLLAGPLWAETARVVSGEHADFTRLVVELPAEADWTVGRTPMGYAFAILEEIQPPYDLSRVWERIPRTRLQALRVDPETGALHLTLACRCHVFPFEYRAGVIVLDIKDGPAPATSAFETSFAAGKRSTSPPPVAAPDRYDWRAVAKDPGDRPGDAAQKALPDIGSVGLDPLRDELLAQISRGAAGGVVDMRLPGKPPKASKADHGDLPWARIRIGELPGIRIADPNTRPETLLPDGAACLPEDLLDLPAWGADRPALELLAEARADLYGEFDMLDTVAVLRAIRLHLYLGFGVEAAQYGNLLVGPDQPGELAIYLSMARLIEGGQDPGTPFAGMLSCDGPAALWAALAHARLPQGRVVNSNAIVRSFQALPPHLRGLLGPDLARKFQDRGDADIARILRDILARTPEVEQATVALIDASADLRADRPESARDHALTAMAGGKNSPDALIALVEAHFRKAEPLSPDTATSLRAFLAEAGGSLAPDGLKRALVLSLALSGQTDDAFSTVAALGVGADDLWQTAHHLAEDDAFLRHAVLPDTDPTPAIQAEVRLAVAGRLLRLGFADAALVWLGQVSPTDDQNRRRLAAGAELARGDARRALQLLAGLEEPEDQGLRAVALVQLGALGEARQAYLAAGLESEAKQLLAWESDWEGLVAEERPNWSDLAALVAPAPLPEAGPLARSQALLDDSAAARTAVATLLSAVPVPQP